METRVIESKSRIKMIELETMAMPDPAIFEYHSGLSVTVMLISHALPIILLIFQYLQSVNSDDFITK